MYNKAGKKGKRETVKDIGVDSLASFQIMWIF
jgi:hypothetical protein